MTDEKVVSRFWDKVEVSSEDECWEWLGAVNPDGYGNLTWESRTHSAHRMSWTINFGDIPDEMLLTTQRKEEVMTALDELKRIFNIQPLYEGEDAEFTRLCAKVVAEATGLNAHWCRVGSEGTSNSLPVLKFGLKKLADILEGKNE